MPCPATLIVNGDAPFTMADLGMISFAFATVVVATVYALGHISGNHINPAVTVGLAVIGKFPWSRVPAYVAAQLVGATIGAAAILGVLGPRASEVGLGVAAFGDGVGIGQAFLAEFVGTFILVFTVFGVIHRKAAAGFAGIAIGLVVFAAIIPVAPATGASINPARTVGPMLVQQLAGGTVQWAQLPVYLLAELAGRRRGGAGLHGDLPDTCRFRRARPRNRRRIRRRIRRSRSHPRLKAETPVKKLINDPADVVAEALRGHRRRPPGAARRPPAQDRLPRRRAGAGQGRADLRRRLRARAAARRVRRPRHARRRLRGRGLHLAGARPDAGGDPTASTAARACCTS